MKHYKKTFDKSHKVTRIFLPDYLLLKSLAQRTGQSMAEALHTIITRDWAMARSVKPVSQPAFRVKAPVSIVTNGSKVPAFRIQPKGVRYD